MDMAEEGEGETRKQKQNTTASKPISISWESFRKDVYFYAKKNEMHLSETAELIHPGI